MSAAKVDRDPQVARSCAERVEAIGPTHEVNSDEWWPPRALNAVPNLDAPGLDAQLASAVSAPWELEKVSPQRC